MNQVTISTFDFAKLGFTFGEDGRPVLSYDDHPGFKIKTPPLHVPFEPNFNYKSITFGIGNEKDSLLLSDILERIDKEIVDFAEESMDTTDLTYKPLLKKNKTFKNVVGKLEWSSGRRMTQTTRVKNMDGTIDSYVTPTIASRFITKNKVSVVLDLSYGYSMGDNYGISIKVERIIID